MRLYGRNSVIERLRFAPQSITRIYMEDGFQGGSYIQKKSKQSGIPIFMTPASKMIKIARNKNTQGIIAETEDFPFVSLDEILQTALDKKRCIIFLDNLNDPQNLGSIIRSLGCLGRFSLVLPTHESVSITETVLRVASGGDNHVPIARVSNLRMAIKKAKENGFCIAGAVVEGGQALDEVDMPFPLALVIGSEQKGIREVLFKELDVKLTIPMAAETLSFNVAHATSIFAYEITRQKKAYAKKREQ